MDAEGSYSATYNRFDSVLGLIAQFDLKKDMLA